VGDEFVSLISAHSTCKRSCFNLKWLVSFVMLVYCLHDVCLTTMMYCSLTRFLGSGFADHYLNTENQSYWYFYL
jgi:hypothetical protein